MSISDKLTTIAENVQKVYEAGKVAGGSGGDSEFWNVHQENGTRTHYSYGFYDWRWEYANPLYKCNVTGCSYMFYGSKKLKNLNPEKFNFEMCLNLTNTFQNCALLEELPFIFSGLQLSSTFRGCTSLQRIGGLDFSRMSSTNNTNAFTDCTALEEIGEITGNITWNGFNVQWSPLTHETLLKIINALSDKTTDTSGTTYTLTLGATNVAKLTEAELDIAYSKGWLIA